MTKEQFLAKFPLEGEFTQEIKDNQPRFDPMFYIIFRLF